MFTFPESDSTNDVSTLQNASDPKKKKKKLCYLIGIRRNLNEHVHDSMVVPIIIRLTATIKVPPDLQPRLFLYKLYDYCSHLKCWVSLAPLAEIHCSSQE